MESKVITFKNPPSAQAENQTTEKPVETTETETTETQPAETPTENTKTEVSEEGAKTETKENPDTKPFKVTFGNEQPSEPVETPELKDEQVIGYLKEKGFEISSFDELKKPELPEHIQKVYQFTQDTGLGIKEYLETQKQWDKETPEKTIKGYYKMKYPHMSDEKISEQVSLIQVTEQDKEELTDSEVKRREFEYNKIYGEALNFMQEHQKKYYAEALKNKPQQPQTPEQIAKAYQPYWDKRDESLSKLNEVKINLDGYGDIKIDITEQDKKLIENITQTETTYFNRWANKDGAIDTDELTEDTLWSVKSTRQKMLAKMFEQAFVLFADKLSKTNRNVDIDSDQPPARKPNEKGSFEVIGQKQAGFNPVI